MKLKIKIAVYQSKVSKSRRCIDAFYLCVWYDSIPKVGTQANRLIGAL